MGLKGTITAPERVSIGENSRALIGGVHNGIAGGYWLRFVNGVIDISASEQDATDNMSGGFEESSRGSRRAIGNFDCLWRSADNPIKIPPRFKPGELTGRIIIWPDYDNDQNNYVKFPIGKCNGFAIIMAGTADVRFTLALRNFGRFYWASDPDPAGVFN